MEKSDPSIREDGRGKMRNENLELGRVGSFGDERSR